MTDPAPHRDHRPPAPPLAISMGPLVAGAVIALVFLHLRFGQQRTAFEDAALGAETSTYLARVGEHPIHCLGLDDAQACLAGVRARARDSLVLWLGNSQVHAINQLREGDETAPALVHRALAARGTDLVAFTFPNANLQEHYLAFEHLREQVPVSVVVVQAVFDDTRESGIRHRLEPAFEDPRTLVALDETPTGRRLRAAAPTQAEVEAEASDADMTALDQTVQERSETWLNQRADEAWPLWQARAEARGSLFLWLYRARNTAFGITAQTVRPRIQSRYDENLAALRDLLAAARRGGIHAVVYVAPLRDDVAPPYVPVEYAEFRDDVRRLADEGGATLLDLEHLVPPALWGRKDPTTLGGEPELDFMHFQARGHGLVAEAITDALTEILEAPPSAP